MYIEEKEFNSLFDNIKLEIYGVRLPEVKIPKKTLNEIGLDENAENAEVLTQLCRNSFNKKIDHSKKQDYVDRFNKEIETIKKLGFTDYLLLVWDVINFCKENEIPVGLGRGSAAGSLILYLIGVTGVDPIRHDLIFERFISEVRAKSQWVDGIQYIDGSLAPDVDLDICTERRPEVVSYLAEKYSGRFCKLPTISKLSSKRVLKDVGKIAGGFSDDDMTKVTALIGSKYGKVFSIEKAQKENEDLEKFFSRNKKVESIARKLENLIRHKGSHASAYLVSYDPLDSFIPCELDTNGEITASYDMNFAQEQSIKLDLLGLHGVTLADKVAKRVGFSIDDFDYDNWETTYVYLKNLEAPYGLFQIGAETNFNVTKKVKPKNIEQLSAVLALARPGALDYVDDYAKYVNEKITSSLHPFFDEILEKTANVALYQEQLMKMVSSVGFSLLDAETMRRIVGKKKPEQLKEWKDKIDNMVKENNIDPRAGEVLWKVAEDSANYSFNKSHSISYSILAAYTIFLKFNYPQEFFIECLEMAQNKSDSQKLIAQIQQELRLFDIELLPPDLIKSKERFTREGKNIRFGYSAIKGVSDKSIDKVKDFLSKDKANKFEVFNAAKQAKLNIGTLGAFIQSGMLNSVSFDREKTVLEAQLWNQLTDKERAYCLSVGEENEFNLIDMFKGILDWKDPVTGKNVARKTRFDTVAKKMKPYKEIYNQNCSMRSFASYYYEKKLLGYSYTTTLQKVFSPHREGIINAETLLNKSDKSFVRGVYEVHDVYKGASRANGTTYIRLTLSDNTGTFTAMLYGKAAIKYERSGRKKIQVDDILYIEGDTSRDSYDEPVGIVFLRNAVIQNQLIYMKLGDLK